MRMQALGTTASQTANAAHGIQITGASGTPVVVTVTTNHRLQVGQRVAIQGTTGLTSMNGIWTLSAVAASTITLDGSTNNGTYGGTPSLAVVMDKTPYMRGHSAVGVLVDGMRNVVAFEGTVLIEGSNQTDAAWTASPTYVDAALYNGDGTTEPSGQLVVPGAGGATQDGIHEWLNVKLFRFMRMRCSAFTAGAVKGYLLI